MRFTSISLMKSITVSGAGFMVVENRQANCLGAPLIPLLALHCSPSSRVPLHSLIRRVTNSLPSAWERSSKSDFLMSRFRAVLNHCGLQKMSTQSRKRFVLDTCKTIGIKDWKNLRDFYHSCSNCQNQCLIKDAKSHHDIFLEAFFLP